MKNLNAWTRKNMRDFEETADVILLWLSPVQFKPVTLSQQYYRLSAPSTRLLLTTNIFKKIFSNDILGLKKFMIV